MRAIVPEEDGVDQRADPKPWLADGGSGGAAAGSDGQQPYRQDGGQQPASYGPAYPAPPAAAVPGQAVQGVRAAPPYPAQVPPAQGVGARITAPFATLTRPRAAKPVSQRKQARAQQRAAAVARAQQRAAARATAARPTVKPAAEPGTAQLSLARIEPWSVMKFSFMISLVGWVVLFVAVAILYYVLSKLGVFHAVQTTIKNVTSSKGSAGADADDQWFSASRILGYTMLIGAVNVFLITAMATVGTVIYNLVTRLAGGIEVTLKETE
jgi:Transmembrane domain of unknown function (DUF3566)